MHSKWLYCIGLEIFESLNPTDFISEINGITIEFNKFSLIHILNRHFAKVLKQFDTKKSFHKEDFKPRILSSQIKAILTLIDNSKFLVNKEIDLIAFKFKEKDYIIYIGKVEVRDNKVYRKLETFFPVDNFKKKNELVEEFNLEKINEELSVYVRK